MFLEDSLVGSIFLADSGQQGEIADAKQIKLMMQDEASYSLPAKQPTIMIEIMDMHYIHEVIIWLTIWLTDNCIPLTKIHLVWRRKMFLCDIITYLHLFISPDFFIPVQELSYCRLYPLKKCLF